MQAKYQGQCLCGSIKYQAEELESAMGHCHCSMCRKFHGAAFATLGEVKKSKFKWLQGEDLLKVYIADNGTKRTFCKHCGSSLMFESAKDNGLLEFSLATLDVAPPLFPDAHIYTSSKVDWVHIENDGLPKYLNGRS